MAKYKGRLLKNLLLQVINPIIMELRIQDEREVALRAGTNLNMFCLFEAKIYNVINYFKINMLFI